MTGAVFNIVLGVVFVAGGASGRMVLLGTGSSGALAVVGLGLAGWGVFQIARGKAR